MSDKKKEKKNSYFTKEELKIFDKYFDEFYAGSFRSSEREAVIQKAYKELNELNPNITINNVKTKFNNLRGNYKKKQKELQNAEKTDQDATSPQKQLPSPPQQCMASPQQQQLPPLQTISPQQPIQVLSPFPQQIQQPPPLQPVQPQQLQPEPVQAVVQTPSNPPVINSYFSQQSIPSQPFQPPSQHDPSQLPSYSLYYNDTYEGVPYDPSSSSIITGFQPSLSTNNSAFPFPSFVQFLKSDSSISTDIVPRQALLASSVNQLPENEEKTYTEQDMFGLLPEMREKKDDASPALYESQIRKDLQSLYHALLISPTVFKVDQGFDKQHIILTANKKKNEFFIEAEKKFIKILDLLPSNSNKTFCNIGNINIEYIPSRTSAMEMNYMNQSTVHIDSPSNVNILTPNKIINFTQFRKIRGIPLSEKLLSFYAGDYLDDVMTSPITFNNPEATTLINYILQAPQESPNEMSEESGENKKEEEKPDEVSVEDYLVIMPVFSFYNQTTKAHVLQFSQTEIETGFFSPINSMLFDRRNEKNRLYLCGDKRVKEFIIEGLDEYVTLSHNGERSVNSEIKIENSGTFYFEEPEYEKSVIAVWQDELVLGVNSNLYFWKLNNDQKNDLTIDTEENVKMAKQAGIDIGKVDWNQGEQASTVRDDENWKKIISIEAINKGEKNSYLAVASEGYPVIYIFNKQHSKVARLISHTLTVSALNSYGFSLISGSLDGSAQIWNLNKTLPEQVFDFRMQKVSAIETANYLGHLFMFVGLESHTVQCWDITEKKQLFEVQLDDRLVPRKIILLAGQNKQYGSFAKLAIMSESIDQSKIVQIQCFEFA